MDGGLSASGLLFLRHNGFPTPWLQALQGYLTVGSTHEAAAPAAGKGGGSDSSPSAAAAADLAARLKPKPVTDAIRRRCQGTKGEQRTVACLRCNSMARLG